MRKWTNRLGSAFYNIKLETYAIFVHEKLQIVLWIFSDLLTEGLVITMKIRNLKWIAARFDSLQYF